MSVLSCEHGVGHELREVIAGRCLSGFGEVLFWDALGTPSGHHAVNVRGLGHGDLILAAVDLHAEEVRDVAFVLHLPTLL